MILNVCWTEAIRSRLRAGRLAGKEPPVAGPPAQEGASGPCSSLDTPALWSSFCVGDAPDLGGGRDGLPASGKVAIFHGGGTTPLVSGTRKASPGTPGLLAFCCSCCSSCATMTGAVYWGGGGEPMFSWSDPNNCLAVPAAPEAEPQKADEVVVGAAAAGDGAASAGGQESGKAAEKK